LNRRGIGLIEALIVLALLTLVIGAWQGVLYLLRRGEARTTDRACALAAAELAAARISLDVKSMLPPDPFRPERCPTAEGARIVFYRCERAGKTIDARRVVYEARADGKPGRFALWRDGRVLAGVTLAGFAARLVSGPRGDPRLSVKLVGVSGAVEHAIELELALPGPGPAATIGMPEDAMRMVERTWRNDI
jgi:hypothetical protein